MKASVILHARGRLKDSQNSKNDHWCTNRHMSTKIVPTVYKNKNKNNFKKQKQKSKVKRQSKQQK